MTQEKFDERVENWIDSEGGVCYSEIRESTQHLSQAWDFSECVVKSKKRSYEPILDEDDNEIVVVFLVADEGDEDITELREN